MADELKVRLHISSCLSIYAQARERFLDEYGDDNFADKFAIACLHSYDTEEIAVQLKEIDETLQLIRLAMP